MSTLVSREAIERVDTAFLAEEAVGWYKRKSLIKAQVGFWLNPLVIVLSFVCVIVIGSVSFCVTATVSVLFLVLAQHYCGVSVAMMDVLSMIDLCLCIVISIMVSIVFFVSHETVRRAIPSWSVARARATCAGWRYRALMPSWKWQDVLVPPEVGKKFKFLQALFPRATFEVEYLGFDPVAWMVLDKSNTELSGRYPVAYWDEMWVHSKLTLRIVLPEGVIYRSL